jgi:dTDP-D-glucose 4,6-dehydratase
MTKRFLMTGGAGFIGSAVVRHMLAATDHHVVVVDKLVYAGNLDSRARVKDHPRFKFVCADIADAAKMREIFAGFQFDVVMHLAAESHVDRSIDGRAEFIQTNVFGTFVLLQQALAHWRELASSKALTILNALEGRPLPVYCKGKNVRDWLYVEDHARALALIAERGRVGHSYNVGANCERSNISVVRAICSLMDELSPDLIGPHERLIAFVADRPSHDLRYVIDARKIRQELGWGPQETFETGLRKTVEWYLTNRQWWERIRSNVYRGERLGAGV